ncbi:MAG: alpha/beta hydrolase [Halioglobus sp.]|nr:alpha/beta hydrolase [Halioglobus sp.]
MQHTEGFFTGERDTAIYHQYWEPEVAPRALLLVAHGAGEHGARYAQFAQQCTARGYVVAAIDHVGHGRSGGTPGDLVAFADYLHDLNHWRELLLARFPDLPQFLVGHSMGGLVAGRYLLDQQAGFVGAVLSASLVITDDAPGPLLRRIINLLARVFPRLGVHKVDASGVSRDPEVVARYEQDPLNYHGSMGTRMLRELFNAVDELKARAAEITLPLLVLHGAEDRLTSPEGSQLLAELASSADKQLTLYPGLYHEIFNEPEREAVIGDVLNWCDARLPAQ